MSTRTKQRIGGGMILLVVGFLSKEVISWLIGQMLDFATGGWTRMDWSAVPWENLALTVAALVGAYLAFWPDRSGPSAEERGRILADQAVWIVERIKPHRQLASWTAERDPLAQVIRDAASLLLSFGKEGLTVPKILDHEDHRRIAAGCQRYFEAFTPLLRDGHWREARDVSPKVAKVAEETATAIQI